MRRAFRSGERHADLGNAVIPAKAGIQADYIETLHPSFQRKLEPTLIFARQEAGRFAALRAPSI